MIYDQYKHLLGRRYTSGEHDCYGLALAFFRDLYGLELEDLARPEGWWNEPGFDLINEMIHVDGWQMKPLNPRNLREGDGLIFSLLHSGTANHIGIYVGNGLFIHHVLGRLSAEEALLPKWTSRMLMVLEHPKVVAHRESSRSKTDLSSLLPDHVKRQIPGLV
jgi:cell wall-associated NlpC family hydrolase